MNFILPVFFICFFAFLFTLYYFSKDDFVVLRKDISLEKIFNLAILSVIFSLISSRLSYAILSGNPVYFQPLVFLAIPYYPGLSLVGALFGGYLFAYAYSSYKNLPTGKMLDLITMSFITILPLGFFLIFLFSLFKVSLFFNVIFTFSVILYFIFAKVILPFSLKGEIEDGSLGLIFLSIFSFIYFTTKLFLDIKNFSFTNIENIMLLFIMFSSLVLLINREIVDKFLIKK